MGRVWNYKLHKRKLWQLIWQSYYLLEDTLKHETPKVVVLSMLAMSEADAKSEAYNRMTLDGMRWSKSKWNSIKESMTKKRRWGVNFSAFALSFKME